MLMKYRECKNEARVRKIHSKDTFEKIHLIDSKTRDRLSNFGISAVLAGSLPCLINILARTVKANSRL